ncbi:MAG: metal ABC transporter permease [Rhodothermales bacterium]|nr:metal ABC transporter permease [Rhodothermales bacterium]MBO6780300.1 metal ABC transporter permease [Rhodothermales bacterium]
MIQPQIEIQLIAMVVAAACAIPGVFLILRQMAMMSDAISHAILPGIVIGFLVTADLGSPLLIAGAALTGVLTVALVELISSTRLIKEDAAIGIVFPALFSVGVILIARFAGDVHLDVDAVLLGELAFAPFDRMVWGGTDVGPRSLYIMGSILLVNVLFVALFFKELKLATFDAGLAAALGLMPGLVHYLLMGLVSVTAVGAFDAVGSILVVALMVGPPSAAYMLTDRLSVMLVFSAGLGAVSAIAGYWMAHWMDASIGGAMATMVGVVFGLAWLLAPERGWLAKRRLRVRQRWQFATKMLTVHLLSHEGQPDAERECREDHLTEHLRWNKAFAEEAVRNALTHGLIERQGALLALTEAGRAHAARAVVEI